MTTDLYVDVVAENANDFTSSSIETLGYDRINKHLVVEFIEGDALYTYEGVTESTFNLLVAAESVGRFYQKYIRNAGFPGSKFEYGYINLRDDFSVGDAEVTFATAPVEIKNGDRVYVTYGHGWDGPGTVVDADAMFPTIRLDADGDAENAGELGGFSPGDYRLLEDQDLQPETKWLTDQFTDLPAVEPAHYSVKYTMAARDSAGVAVAAPVGPFEPEFDALSEADALSKFEDAIKQMENATDWTIDTKVLAVTHYFD